MGNFGKVLVVTSLLIPYSAWCTEAGADAQAHQSALQAKVIGNKFGPTQSTTTLWGIAKELAGKKGVSINQMADAIYKANPSAFNHENANSLMRGVYLTIPDITPAESHAAVKATESLPPVPTSTQAEPVAATSKPESVAVTPAPEPVQTTEPQPQAETTSATPVVESLSAIVSQTPEASVATSESQSPEEPADSAQQTVAHTEPADSSTMGWYVTLILSLVVIGGWISVKLKAGKQQPLPDPEVARRIRQSAVQRLKPVPDEFGFSFDFTKVKTIEDETDRLDDEGKDINAKEEHENKLNLAKAYIDMGLLDEAQALLQEVELHGDIEQQHIARQLSASIGSDNS